MTNVTEILKTSSSAQEVAQRLALLHEKAVPPKLKLSLIFPDIKVDDEMEQAFKEFLLNPVSDYTSMFYRIMSTQELSDSVIADRLYTAIAFQKHIRIPCRDVEDFGYLLGKYKECLPLDMDLLRALDAQIVNPVPIPRIRQVKLDDIHISLTDDKGTARKIERYLKGKMDHDELEALTHDVPSPAMTHAFFSLMMAGMNPPRDVFTPELVAEYYEDVYSS